MSKEHRFNLYLPREAFAALNQLKKRSGKPTLAATVRSALKLYQVVQDGMAEGKRVVLVHKKTGRTETLVNLKAARLQ